jgi:hypothetical protein
VAFDKSWNVSDKPAGDIFKKLSAGSSNRQFFSFGHELTPQHLGGIRRNTISAQSKPFKEKPDIYCRKVAKP